MSEWRAVESLKTAFDKTKALLIEPFDLILWLKLTVIVFLAGSIGSGFNSPGSGTSRIGDYGSTGGAMPGGLSDSLLITIIIAIILLIFIIVILFLLLRGIFSFVFVRALTTGDASIIGPMFDNFGKGLRLFLFLVLVSIVSILVSVIFIGMIIAGIFIAVEVGLSSFISTVIVALIAMAILAVLAVYIVLMILLTIFTGYTIDFVVPYVYFKGMSIFGAWGVLWEQIGQNWKEFGLYTIIRWIAGFTLNMVLGFILLPFILVAIVLVAIAAMIAINVSETSIVLATIIGLLTAIGIIIMIVLSLLISMPVAVYFRYYSLDFLKSIDPSAVVYSGRFSPGPVETGYSGASAP